MQPLNFAYTIHTIGDNCVGSEVDGIKVPQTRLRNDGQLNNSASGQKPSASWEEMVVTGRAKAAIRKSIREEEEVKTSN